MRIVCPCGSGKKYRDCCKILHDGTLPKNALELMRSRYSAYALKNIAYILNTTHPKNSQYQQDRAVWAQEIRHFCDNTQFQKLQIIEFIDGEYEAYVTFRAHLKQAGKDVSFTEKSHFEKVDGGWLYKCSFSS